MKAIDVNAHPDTAAFDRKRMWGPEMVKYRQSDGLLNLKALAINLR